MSVISEYDLSRLSRASEEKIRHELVKLAFDLDGSVRLKNTLLFAQNLGLLEGISAASIAADDLDATQRLLKIRGFGRQCLNELKALSLNMGLAPPHRPAELDVEGLTANPAPDIPAPLDALAYLKDSFKAVIVGRLGLDGRPPRVLNDLGLEMGLTRERVRQIEAGAMRRLRTLASPRLKVLLADRQAQILTSLATSGAIPEQEESRLFAALTPDARLMVRVLHKSVREWLDETCHPVSRGWLLPELSVDAYAQVDKWLNSIAANEQLPCLLQPPTADEDFAAALHAAILLSNEVRQSGGYLLPRRSTKRALRAVRVHSLLMAKRGGPLLLSTIKEQYRVRYLDDFCSARDIAIVLADNRHLFLNQYEMGWLALGLLQEVSSVDQGQKPELSEPPQDDDDISSDTDSIRGLLTQILVESGPLPFTDLRKEFMRRSNLKYSKASVGPILISYDDFVRIGPGVYCIRSQLKDGEALKLAARKSLMNSTQCELFCRALWAGEPEDSYYLWTKEVQVQWAEWCEATGNTELLASLLHVADIESWPVKAGDRSRWLRLKNRIAFYSLDEPPNALSDRFVSYQDFLRCAHWVIRNQKISWISINRLTGHRADDRHAVSNLALLIAAGFLVPSAHWQHQHVINPNVSESLTQQLTTENRWPLSVIQAMRRAFSNLEEPGWVDVDEVTEMLDALNQTAINSDELLRELDEESLATVELQAELVKHLRIERLHRRLTS